MFNLPSGSYSTPLRIGVIVLTLWMTLQISDWRLIGLLIAGMGLGASLNYFVFGFSSGWRRFILEKRTEGIRAQIIMISLALLLFSPLLLLGQIGDWTFQGLVRPNSLSVMVGAFLFGIGMQLAGNCSSGTLNRVGQLQPLSFISFIMLFVGGTLAAYTFDTWSNWWTLPPFSVTLEWGIYGLVLALGLFMAIYFWNLRIEAHHHTQVQRLITKSKNRQKWHISPFWYAAIALALFNFLILILAGQPWSVASVFTVWSLKFSDSFHLGLDWSFWTVAGLYENRITASLWQDAISITTLGVILGSLWVQVFQHVKPTKPAYSLKQTGLYAIGGLLMGFGATLSYGCNIGAFFSGVASGSLHGVLWVVFAFIGNWIALKWILKNNSTI